MTKIVCVAGARPNFMKIAPVLAALEADGHDVDLLHTGQHHDAAMSGVFFDDLGLRSPDVHLGAGSGSIAVQLARVIEAFDQYLLEARPEIAVVVGDVTSTLASALAAAHRGVVVAHVEAGLRSNDWAMPEEINRIAVDRISQLLFAPSPDAVENLHAEGRTDRAIHLVGNVMIDSLLANVERARTRSVAQLDELRGLEQGFVLATLHRPANVDEPGVLTDLLGALASSPLPVVIPTHPRLSAALEKLTDVPSGLSFIEPLGYLDFVSTEDRARLVVTDSGGVQEETTALGVPCLTVRDSTERPITVSHGTNRVVGVDPDVVADAIRMTLASPPPPRRPELWDGHAAARIAEVLRRPDLVEELRSSDPRIVR